MKQRDLVGCHHHFAINYAEHDKASVAVIRRLECEASNVTFRSVISPPLTYAKVELFKELIMN